PRRSRGRVARLRSRRPRERWRGTSTRVGDRCRGRGVTGLLLRGASIAPGEVVDVGVVDGRVAELPDVGARAGWDDVDLGGRRLLPGLAAHQVPLLATAAAWAWVDCPPAALAAAGGLGAVLGRARERQPDGWLRGIEYDVTQSGPLDRAALDTAAVGPVRV